MSQTLNIQTAEKRAFRLATFEDGIWEMYLGLFFTVMSCYSLTRDLLGPVINAILFLGVIFLLVGLGWQAKKRFTLPRTGLVKLGSQTKRKIRTANIIILTLVTATFAILILSAQNLLNEPTWSKLPQWVTDFDIDLVFALITMGLFCIVAYSIAAPRFYLHGVLLGLGNFIATVMVVYQDTKFKWPLALTSLIIAAIGTIVLFKFLREYPLPTEGNHG